MSVRRPSSGRPFTGASLDRVSVERKNAEWVRDQAVSERARGIGAGRDAVLVNETGLTRLPYVADRDPILLGREPDGAPLFAVDLEVSADRRTADDGSWGADGGDQIVSLREAGTELPHAEAGLAAYAVALLGWHRRHGFCANCGHATEVAEGGYLRVCPSCGAHHFPRTDPVVIMSVGHEDRLLLGRRSGWPEGRLSVLAGFISPGESAEEAVVREVEEESGIVCRDPRFVTSQPWPFPASLMLGFHAESDGGDPRPTDDELDEVRWVPRDQVRRAIAGEDVGFELPGAVSVARYLVESWAEAR